MSISRNRPHDASGDDDTQRTVDIRVVDDVVGTGRYRRALPTVPAAEESRDYLAVLKRRQSSIVLVVLLSIALAVGLTLVRHPSYRATAELLLPETANGYVPGANASVQPIDPTRVLATAVQVIKGPDVRAGVRARLGSAPTISAIALPQADVIQITGSGSSADAAATVANAYANSYIDLRRKQTGDAVTTASQDIQKEIDNLQAQINHATGTDRDTLLQAQASFRQRLGQLRVDSAGQNAAVRLLAAATPPHKPAGPTPIMAGLWGALLGLILGVGVAYGRDVLDDSVRTKEDAERAIPGLPVVGLIPVLDGHDRENPRLVTADDPHSAAAEAYRTLRTSIQFLDIDHRIRILQVTGPSQREGKTTTVANLGIALAQSNQRVVIVCCDLRRPVLHEFFGLANDIGLTSVLKGQSSIVDAIKMIDEEPLLMVLPSGPVPPNPTELLSSKRAADVLMALQKNSDIVLLDCPPVLPVADSLVIAGVVDASLIVCRAGVTTRRDLTRTVELLRQVDAPLAGVILNATPTTAVYGGGYGYYQDSRK